jgi:hypothetical protein
MLSCFNVLSATIKYCLRGFALAQLTSNCQRYFLHLETTFRKPANHKGSAGTNPMCIVSLCPGDFLHFPPTPVGKKDAVVLTGPLYFVIIESGCKVRREL